MGVTVAGGVPSMAWSHFNPDLTEYGGKGSELQITASPAFFTVRSQGSGRVVQVFFSSLPQ